MNTPGKCSFTKEHEWALLEGTSVRVGITAYAQQELGDVVFVELPQIGKEVQQGKAFSSVESVKAVSDIYAPVSGTVTEVNNKLSQAPELINSSPYEQGWIAVISPNNMAQLETLLTAEEYDAFISEISK